MTDITANVIVSMPSQLFTMARSFKAVANGKIYIGKIDTDPVNPENQIQVYVENEDGSHVPVAQPIIINAAGYPVYNGQIAKFVTVQGHSMAVYDAYGAQQFYFPNVLKYDPDRLRTDLSGIVGAWMVGYGDSTVGKALGGIKRRDGDVVYVSDYIDIDYTPGMVIDDQLLQVVSAVNGIANTEHNGKPVTLEFPSGWFKHSSTLWFKRPVILTSAGNTKLEFNGTSNQIKFGPDGITFNGDSGGIDHRLHVTYGFIGHGLFTFTGNLSADGIVFNEYITNPRILGLRFINYGSESHYMVKLWGNCWDITVDNILHSNDQSKAVNFLSANGKMKNGTVDYGNSRLHVGRDVYMQIEGARSGGVCFDVGGADYVFEGVAHGWRVTHQLGAFASNPVINGYHETIFPECEALITYGGLPEDTVVRDDHYFDGGVLGATSLYWNAHNVSGPEGYTPTTCVFMKPGRTDVVLRNTRIGVVNLASYDNTKVLVTTNLIDNIPSYGNEYDSIGFPNVRIHQQNALVQPWTPAKKTEVLTINGSGRLSRSGSSFTFNTTATNARVFDFWEYASTGAAVCNFYRNLLSDDTQFTHEGTTIGIVIPTANADSKSLRCVLDKNAFKMQGKTLTLSFMGVNGNPTVPTSISVNLILVFSSSGGVSRTYSFGSFDLGSSFGLKSFSLNIPFLGLTAADDAKAYLSFELPTEQTVNIVIANVNLATGNVAVQGPSDLKYWDLLSRSIAYYGS
ncbi:phage head-binding domain-containing protein [Escherichia coli]